LDQTELLRRTIELLEEQQVVYMLVGSLASGVYGQPRLTNDIDVVVEVDLNQVRRLCGAFPPSDNDVSLAAAEQAVRHGGQFNVLHPSSGNKIDFMIARRDAWGREQLSRRRKELVFPDRSGYTASREDVILGKLWYFAEGGSEKHLRDIASILQTGAEEIDFAYVTNWAQKLGWSEIWQGVVTRLNRNSGG